MGNGTHGQRGIIVNTVDRDGAPWGMGHMGDRVHVQWGTWAIGHMVITSLILHGSLQGVLSLGEGTYPGWGYVPWPERYLTWLGVLTFAWSTSSGKGATYLWKGVPTLAGEVPTLARGYVPWLGDYLP